MLLLLKCGMECLVDTPNKKLSLCQTSVVFGWCLFAVDSSSHRRRFFYFFRMKKTNTREGTKTWEKNISKVTRKKRRHSKNRHKKNDGRPFRESRFGSIDRSITTTTEYRVHRHRQKPKLGDLFLFDAAL